MKVLRPLASWGVTLLYLLLRWTCRIKRHGDPRDELRGRSQAYIYSVLHAHHVATLIDGEPGTGAMVSQSGDGALVLPCLRICGGVPIRGSSDRNGKDRGGRAAFRAMVRHIESTRPAYFAVDGPRGPRNRVHGGVALLAIKTDAVVLNVCAVPRRRWILTRSWDRLQIPMPFSTIDVYFSEPISIQPGEKAEQLRQRIEAGLNAMERECDADEAERAQPTEPRALLADAA